MKTTSIASIVALSIGLAFAPAGAEPAPCSEALKELSFKLEAHELPARHLVDHVEKQCPADVGELVDREIGRLKVNVLASRLQRLDASRLESYDELKQTLNKSGAGKRASGNQAFGVALQALRPVLAVQLQEKIRQ